jgi:16S rRNA (guanine(1405)-N(7))-methyltransferase
MPKALSSDAVKSFCIQQMRSHASTSERLPILEDFFSTCFASVAPITSIADLACGLNPLALPWMPLAPGFRYWACDIYLDMLGFIQAYFNHFSIDGKAIPCDLISESTTPKAQVAMLLKSIPCLEQVDKSIGKQLLDKIQAEHILISFPVSSLGGHRKGMPSFYRDHFYSLIDGKPWKIKEFSFSTELAFLVTK